MREASFEEALGRSQPDPIMWVVSVDDDGNPNVMPIGWYTTTSMEPRMMGACIGHEKYSHELLANSDDFVLAYPSKVQKEAVLFCGNNSGADVNKFEETDLETAPSSKVDAPLIENSVAAFECEKKSSFESGSHTIFVGEVVETHVSDEYSERLYTVENWIEKGVEGLKTISEL